MALQELLKTFVVNAKEYHINHSEEVANNLQRCLQILGASSDINLFDPGSREVVDFFVSLHELMTSLDINSSLVWPCISVLQEASRNAATRNSLIHTYKFTPILTRILCAQQVTDRRIQVLQILQELTYGIKISWQESHLKQLITTLTCWIMGNEKELVPLSLGVLVNICYKNVPSIYTLVKSINTQNFLRILLNLQNNNDQQRMQVCKLLITLECVSGGLPESEVKTYVKLTCPSLIDAVKSNNSSLMRHAVNYFQEIIANPNMSRIVNTYESFGDDIFRLLQCLEGENNLSMDCLSVLFEFLSLLVRMFGERSDVISQTAGLVSLALQWVCTQGVSAQALTLITMVVAKLNIQADPGQDAEHIFSAQQEVVTILQEKLDVILLLLDTGGCTLLSGDEVYTRYSALLKLLGQFMDVPIIAPRLMSTLSPVVFQKIFSPLLNSSSEEKNNLFQEPVYTLYVQALSLLIVLANHETNWFVVLEELVKEKQVHMVLAVALYTGPEEVKKEVLALCKAHVFPTQRLETLAECLSDMNNLMMFAPSSSQHVPTSTPTPFMSPIDINQLLTLSQEGYLNSLLHKCEEAITQNNCGLTSSVMELYKYKMASMSYTMRTMQSSQEAADSKATKLQHCLALTSAEVSRLHQLLQVSQQQLSSNQAEITQLRVQLGEYDKRYVKQKQHLLQAEQTLKSKTRIITEQSQNIDELSQGLQEKLGEIESKSSKIKALEESLSHKSQETLQLEKTVKDLNAEILNEKKTITELHVSLENEKKLNVNHRKELDNKTKTIDNLKKDITNQSAVNQKLEKLNAEKDKTIGELNQQLGMILELAAKRKQ